MKWLSNPLCCIKVNFSLRQSQPTRIIFYLIIILLLLVGTFRLFSFILHEPLLAYANNYDMIRIQACHRVWPADSSIPPGVNSPAFPFDNYKIDKSLKLGTCFLSAELVFTFIGEAVIKILGLATGEDSFSIRIFGLIRGLLLSALAIGFSLWFLAKEKVTASLSNSLIYATVLTDPANTLYLNTFYTEYSAIFFTYLSLLLLYCVCVFKNNHLFPLILGGTLLLLGLSKPQHLLLPIIILISLLIVNWRGLLSMKRTILFALLGVAIGLAYQVITLQYSGHIQAIKYANATDTFLGAVLPAASDPYKAATILRLPRHCTDHIGKTWYTPSVGQDHPCPEVLETSRIRILLLIFKDPLFLVNITSNGIKELRPWIVTYLGQVDDREYGHVSQFTFTISEWLDKISDNILIIMFLAPLAVYIPIVIAITKKISVDTQSLAVIIMALLSSMYGVFFSAIFGDGYIEFAKHTHMFFSFYISVVIIGMLVAVQLSFRRLFSKINKAWNEYKSKKYLTAEG